MTYLDKQSRHCHLCSHVSHRTNCFHGCTVRCHIGKCHCDSHTRPELNNNNNNYYYSYNNNNYYYYNYYYTTSTDALSVVTQERAIVTATQGRS